MSRRDQMLSLVLRKRKVAISSLPKTAYKPSPVKIAHKPSPLETTYKPSPLDTGHKPSSPVIAYKPSPVETAHKPSSAVTAYKPSSPETACKPSSPVTAYKPSSPVTAYKPSSPVTAYKPSSPVTAYKPSSPVTVYKPSSPVTAYKPSSPVTAYRPSSPETAYKPSSPVTAYKPSSPVTTDKPSSPETANVPLLPDIIGTLSSEPDTQTPHFHTRGSLVCYETMPSEDEENNESADVDMYEDSDDSVRDQNYEPPTQRKKKKYYIADAFIRSSQKETAPRSVVALAEDHEIPVSSSQRCHKDLPRNHKTVFPEPPSDDIEPDTQTPPFHNRSLVCYETMPSEDEENNESADVDIYEDSDDSVKDQNYELPTQRKKKKYYIADAFIRSSQKETAPRSVVALAEVHEIPVSSSQRCHEDLPLNHKTVFPEPPSDDIEVVEEQVEDTLESNLNTDALPETEENYTKSGALRKRRKFKTPLSQRVQEKIQKTNEKLNLKEPCTEKCRKKCTSKISQEERKNIHDRFVNLNWESRGLFIKGLVEPEKVKTRTVKEDSSPKRNISYKYKFYVNSEKVEVCKTYFLTTLGYHPQNNTHLHKVLEKPVDEQMDKRGSYERKNVIDKDVIKAHIKNYNPVVSHYRREHAPLKLYLPSDITISSMHQNFTKSYPQIKISFETYRRVLKELNISFARLGNEECEQCALFKSHKDSNECSDNECSKDPTSCEKCLLYHKHNFKYTTSREAYKADVIAASTDGDTVYYSVDLQKVIMIPRMDQYKIAIFCPRIIAFNESFVPLGKTKEDKMPFAVLWNEAISGRNQEDILSAFRCFLLHKRDAKHVVIWADNCAAQNKNWAFMCFLVNMVNSELTATETITVKYFEPGHSFMSADHFHHQVEMSLKKKNKVYDFDDFVDSVQNANSRKNIVHVMSVSDFFMFEDSSSQHKIRNIAPRVYLRDIMSVKAEKGHYMIKFKENLDSEWKELDFLQVKVKKSKIFPNAVPKSAPRGITKERKEEILAKLVPLMPEHRRNFWRTLPESTKAHSNLATEN